jgi:fructose-1,6-bisphosphatase/inositol monophosphatase family enzyme
MNKLNLNFKVITDYIYQIQTQASEEIIIPLYGCLKNDQISSKSRFDDYVTEADKNSEKFLKPKLQELIKGSNFIGEESYDKSITYEKFLSDYTWTCDPIDGTYNYVNNLDKFCIMISLCKSKTPIASWLYFPVFKIFCYTIPNSAVIFSNKKNKIKAFRKNGNIEFEVINGSKSIIDELFGNFTTQKDKHGLTVSKNLRCAGFEVVALVCGKVDYMKHKYLTPWDHSPVYDLAKSSGCHIKFNPKASTFKFNFNGQLLCTSSKLIYDKLNKQY